MNDENKIKVVFWNANSIKNKIHELQCITSKKSPDIIGICETKLMSSLKLKIPGYRIYRTDRNIMGGGVLLAVKNKIKHTEYYSHICRWCKL